MSKDVYKRQGIDNTKDYPQIYDWLEEGIQTAAQRFEGKKVKEEAAILPLSLIHISRLRTDHLTPEENKVFSLVAARFLAVFYPAYVYEATKMCIRDR